MQRFKMDYIRHFNPKLVKMLFIIECIANTLLYPFRTAYRRVSEYCDMNQNKLIIDKRELILKKEVC